jgi:hypothetical protein
VHNIEEMVRNIERHGDDDQYSNDKLAKYKKMIEDSKKPLYHGCTVQYTRLFMMVKLFQLKASNGWSDCIFKDLLMLLKDMLPQGNAILETIYEVKQIIYPLGLEVMMRTTTETEEKASLKGVLGLLYHSSFEAMVCKQGVRIVAMTQREV